MAYPEDTQINWRTVQPQLKWKILRRQWRFGLWALYSSIGSMMLGYDFSVAGTCTAFPSFQKVFGHPYAGASSGYVIPARIQSGWSGASTAGDIIGIIVGGFALDRLGRKHTMIAGALFTAIGVGMQQGAHEWRLFLVGRLVNAFGFGMVFVESPVWIGETVRPELRGFFLCLMNGSIVLAQFFLACVAQGASKITSDWSWKLIVILQYIFVIPLMVFYFWFPESPYFLLKKGRQEQARRSLESIHGRGDQELIEAEMLRIQENVDFSEAILSEARSKGPLLQQCFRGTNKKRTLIAMMSPAAQQAIGSAFVLQYITYFLELIGVTNYFLVSLILYVVMLLSNLAAFFVVEVVGRRKLLVPGLFSLTIICLILGIMGCLSSQASLWVSVVCVFLWAAFYQMTIGAVGFTLSSEVSSLPLRPMVQGLVGVTQGVVGWTLGFVTPYMINPDEGNLGAKVGFVFFGLGIPFSILFFFFAPETKGLNFDEIDYLFTSKVNTRKFQEAIAVYRARDGADLKAVKEATVTGAGKEMPVVQEVESART